MDLCREPFCCSPLSLKMAALERESRYGLKTIQPPVLQCPAARLSEQQLVLWICHSPTSEWSADWRVREYVQGWNEFRFPQWRAHIYTTGASYQMDMRRRSFYTLCVDILKKYLKIHQKISTMFPCGKIKLLAVLFKQMYLFIWSAAFSNLVQYSAHVHFEWQCPFIMCYYGTFLTGLLNFSEITMCTLN